MEIGGLPTKRNSYDCRSEVSMAYNAFQSGTLSWIITTCILYTCLYSSRQLQANATFYIIHTQRIVVKTTDYMVTAKFKHLALWFNWVVELLNMNIAEHGRTWHTAYHQKHDQIQRCRACEFTLRIILVAVL